MKVPDFENPFSKGINKQQIYTLGLCVSHQNMTNGFKFSWSYWREMVLVTNLLISDIRCWDFVKRILATTSTVVLCQKKEPFYKAI